MLASQSQGRRNITIGINGVALRREEQYICWHSRHKVVTNLDKAPRGGQSCKLKVRNQKYIPTRIVLPCRAERTFKPAIRIFHHAWALWKRTTSVHFSNAYEGESVYLLSVVLSRISYLACSLLLSPALWNAGQPISLCHQPRHGRQRHQEKCSRKRTNIPSWSAQQCLEFSSANNKAWQCLTWAQIGKGGKESPKATDESRGEQHWGNTSILALLTAIRGLLPLTSQWTSTRFMWVNEATATKLLGIVKDAGRNNTKNQTLRAKVCPTTSLAWSSCWARLRLSEEDCLSSRCPQNLTR